MTALSNAERSHRYYQKRCNEIKELRECVNTLLLRVNTLEQQNQILMDRVNTADLLPLEGSPTPLPKTSSSPPTTVIPPSGDITSVAPQGADNHSATKRKDLPNAKRGTRLPADWQPSAEDCFFAEQLGLDAGRTADEFCDYWIAKPGQPGCKLDWRATWRNWCRKAQADQPARRPDRFREGLEHLRRAVERAEARKRGEGVEAGVFG